MEFLLKIYIILFCVYLIIIQFKIVWMQNFMTILKKLFLPGGINKLWEL